MIRKTPLRPKKWYRPPARKASTKVTPALREYIMRRDRGCVAAKVDPEHQCRNQWGDTHAATDLDQMTIEHVHDHARLGLRAASDKDHCLTLCWASNVLGWASAHRDIERAYLARVERIDE